MRVKIKGQLRVTKGGQARGLRGVKRAVREDARRIRKGAAKGARHEFAAASPGDPIYKLGNACAPRTGVVVADFATLLPLLLLRLRVLPRDWPLGMVGPSEAGTPRQGAILSLDSDAPYISLRSTQRRRHARSGGRDRG